MNWGPDKEILFFPVAEKCKDGTHTHTTFGWNAGWIVFVKILLIMCLGGAGGRKAIFLTQNRDCINYRRLLNVPRSYYQLTGEAVARLREEGLDRRITINAWLRFRITQLHGDFADYGKRWIATRAKQGPEVGLQGGGDFTVHRRHHPVPGPAGYRCSRDLHERLAWIIPAKQSHF